MKIKTIIFRLALAISVVAVMCVIISIAFISHNLQNQAPNKTTDTWSTEFYSQKDKIVFLAEYLIMPSEVLDAEYHIVYYDNSGGVIPGPSDWDVRVALKIQPNDLPLWLDGFVSAPEKDINLSWWDELSSANFEWGNDGAEYYRRSDVSFSYLVVFPEAGVILKAVSTMAYDP